MPRRKPFGGKKTKSLSRKHPGGKHSLPSKKPKTTPHGDGRFSHSNQPLRPNDIKSTTTPLTNAKPNFSGDFNRTLIAVARGADVYGLKGKIPSL